MKINPVHNLYYSRSLGFTGDAGRKATSPFSVESPKSGNCHSYEVMEKYADNVLSALNDRKEELYDFLDSVTDENGLTISDKLLSMFDTENSRMGEYTFLHKTLSNNAESLQKNGFDSARISKTNFGPGFYVGVSEGGLLIYPGVKMQVEYKGNTVQGKTLSEYDGIKSEAVNKLREYLNLKPDFSNPLIWKEIESFSKFINEYSRKTIAEHGIDGAWALGSDGYFVIFNPDAIKEIKPFNG